MRRETNQPNLARAVKATIGHATHHTRLRSRLRHARGPAKMQVRGDFPDLTGRADRQLHIAAGRTV